VGGVAGEWCSCHREPSPRGNKINILNEKLDFLMAQQILIIEPNEGKATK
jgi:hypothetical protein